MDPFTLSEDWRVAERIPRHSRTILEHIDSQAQCVVHERQERFIVRVLWPSRRGRVYVPRDKETYEYLHLQMTASVFRNPDSIGKQFLRFVDNWLPLWYEQDEIRQQWEADSNGKRLAAERLREAIGPEATIIERSEDFYVYGPDRLRIHVLAPSEVIIESPLPSKSVLSLIADLKGKERL